ncbi:MAG TPA: PrgI family protein [Candidatus Saccharimonadales bacterium]|nr:PrgI family protein [Candidatus Saccharimonadales bacterium]
MATYKVIQDVEAEDKLVGPLTLRQFIYACIAATCLYLGFLSLTKHAQFMLAIFLPVAGVTGFFAFPWGQDQPTEIWALAKIRFFLKPRRRIWDQSGTKELVTITVPKRIEHRYTNGLNQDEVRSRLNALANTIDSRGWAIKNVNVNLNTGQEQAGGYNSDRLVNASNIPQEVTSIDVRASDDILDESANPIARQFDSMINASASAHRQQIMAQLATPTPVARPPQPAPSAPVSQPNYWFTQQPSATPVPTPVVDAFSGMPLSSVPPLAPVPAANPTPEEEALVAKFKQENSSQTVAYGHLKTVKTPEQLAAEAAQAQAAARAKPTVTPEEQADIINLSNNDDLSVAAIARQANKQAEDTNEVVISLH